MFQANISKIILLCLLIGLLFPAHRLHSQEQSTLVIEDFESADFSDTWWSYKDGGQFECDRNLPGYDSDYALHTSSELGAAEYAGCGRDVLNAETWTDSLGLQFVWWGSNSDIEVSFSVEMLDATQTNPESEGTTPFVSYLETPNISDPNTSWLPVSLPWSSFQKAEWVGATGVTTLDISQIVAITIEINEAQSGAIWLDNIAVMYADASTASTGLNPVDKFSLWTNGTQLRGANIWQRIVVPELDGDEFLGNGHLGPPYTQDDFDRMAAEGANYVNISHPGLFTENAPYVLDEGVQSNLDNLLTMIANADMFAVISFRTGPGRSDFTFYDDNIEEWGDPALVIEHIWTDEAAQDAWVEMWRYTAARYRDNGIVVGYDLMVEPNAAGRLLDIWEPEEFYPAYANTLYDWNQLYPRLVESIRTVDSQTPILVSAMGWGAVRWLPYLQPIDDPHIVYAVHQYEPQDDYTHQDYPAEISYPGQLDLDWDGQPDAFGPDWLDAYLSTIDEFQDQYGVPVVVNEYGLIRWVPGAAAFMKDEMRLFEARGLNHAFWMFNPSWPPHAQENDDFDFWHGADPNNHATIETSDVLEVIRANWSLNSVRPSDIVQQQ